jgi:hypothetical protein
VHWFGPTAKFSKIRWWRGELKPQAPPRKPALTMIERQTWTTRGGLRSMTRLSNGFLQKKAALDAAVALWYAFYNFCHWHETIRCTPATQAGITSSI